MEKRKLSFFFLLSLIFSLGFISFISCIIAETKKAKKRDLKLDGKLCFLSESQAAAFGVTALICLSLAELTGNLVLCINYCSRGKGKKSIKPIIPATLLLFSWISYGLAVTLISVATSMSRVQLYGEGWLDGECYTVKDGVYVGSGMLSLAAVFALIGAAAVTSTTTTRRSQNEQGRKVHAQNA